LTVLKAISVFGLSNSKSLKSSKCLCKGDVFGRDGCVYAIPTNYHSVLRINCETEEVSVFGDEEWDGKEKWEGGVVGKDGVMYCMPQQSSTVLKIVPGEPLL